MSEPISSNRFREYRPAATNAGPRPLPEERELSNVLESVRTGFDRAVFEIVRRRLGVTTVELAELLGLVPGSTEAANDGDVGSWVDPLTLSRRPAEGNGPAGGAWRVRGAAADRLDELARLGELGLAVFGDEPACARWFRSDLRALDGARPLDYLDVRAGRARVRDILYAIEYGHVS